MVEISTRRGPFERGPGEILPAGSLSERVDAVGRLLAEAGVPFLLIVYLALKGGGYDEVIYEEVGVAVWWIVMLGALVGVLPRARVGRSAWVALALLAGFTVWTGLGISWSQSAEESTTELARLGTYLGIFALAISCQRPGSIRRSLHAVAAAITLVGGLALMQRYHPSWFPANGAAQKIPASIARLNYPLNYWNGLATLVAIGMPLLIVAAHRARTLPGQALAAAPIPALALVAYLTLSRGGVIELGVALVVLVALYPRRWALLPILATTAVGSAILIGAMSERDTLQNGLATPTAHAQANEMLAMTLVVCVATALICVAIGVAARNALGPRPARLRRPSRRVTAAALAAILVAALAAGVPGTLSNRWEDFNNPAGTSDTGGNITTARFDSASGNGRYQWWSSALDANATAPLIGIGPGTFQYWWDQHGTIPGSVRDAHSLYFQTLAETGIIGFLLIAGLIGVILVVAIRAARRATADRTYLAAAAAACVAFATSAAIDWVWQLAVLPAAFFIIAAAALAGRSDARVAAAGRRLGPRLRAAVLSVAALIAIALPLARASAVAESQSQAKARALQTALADAKRGHSIQPYAASPSLETALIYELGGDYPAAVSAAEAATRSGSTNWRNWLVLSRVQAEAGNAQGSVEAYERAKALNPRSPIFSQ